MLWFLQTHNNNLLLSLSSGVHLAITAATVDSYIPCTLIYSWLYLRTDRLPKFEFKVVSSSSHAWYLWCSTWGDTSTHSVWGWLLCEMMKTKGRSFCDIFSLWDGRGWLQHFTRLLSCQSGAQRWGRDTPGNQSKLTYYLFADKDKTISFLNSSQNEVG